MSFDLSICIPTYNRSEYLKECLTSVLTSVAGHERDTEIVISDNASTDNTGDIVRAFQETHPWIRYHRNEQNIGGERNFRHVATLAQGEHIWVFGDDDKMEANAVPRVLEGIRAGYDLTICNYSSWDKQFAVQVKQSSFPDGRDQIFNDPNKLMEHFGLHLGYISSVVIKKALFLKLPADEYEAYTEYGFPFLFAVYNGVAKCTCKVKFIADPIFCNRGGNSGDYDWYKYFVTGSSLIFDELLHKGYTISAVSAAKQAVLSDFVVKNIVDLKFKMTSLENKQVLNLLYKHYKSYWQFWLLCLPRLLTPIFLLLLAKNTLRKFRRLRVKKI